MVFRDVFLRLIVKRGIAARGHIVRGIAVEKAIDQREVNDIAIPRTRDEIRLRAEGDSSEADQDDEQGGGAHDGADDATAGAWREPSAEIAPIRLSSSSSSSFSYPNSPGNFEEEDEDGEEDDLAPVPLFTASPLCVWTRGALGL